VTGKNHFGKEESIMKYRKPELALTANAIADIQSHVAKGQYQPPDSMQLTTNTAYEADE
jgi:hypothetical protein